MKKIFKKSSILFALVATSLLFFSCARTPDDSKKNGSDTTNTDTKKDDTNNDPADNTNSDKTDDPVTITVGTLTITTLKSYEKTVTSDETAKTITFDDDSPEMTPDMLNQFKRIKQKNRTKKTASIRLSEKAQRFSSSYGKGYTSFLSRLIDAALDDAALVKKCL